MTAFSKEQSKLSTRKVIKITNVTEVILTFGVRPLSKLEFVVIWYNCNDS